MEDIESICTLMFQIFFNLGRKKTFYLVECRYVRNKRKIMWEINMNHEHEETNKENRKIKENDLKSTISIIISLAALIISYANFYRSNAVLIPKFSLEVTEVDESNSNDLNRTIKIYNAEGEIVNPKIEPVMQLELNFCFHVGVEERAGNVLLEFSDYFSEDYAFNNNESSFIVKETKVNEVYELIDKIYECPEMSGIDHMDFSIKHYFKISYYDYRCKKKEIILYPEYNNVYLNYCKYRRIRELKDPRLNEINHIDEAYIRTPIDLTDGGLLCVKDKEDYDALDQLGGHAVTLIKKDKAETKYNLNDESELDSVIALFINKYLMKNSDNIGYIDDEFLKISDNAEGIFENNKEIAIGFIKRKKQETKIYEIATIIVVIFETIIFLFCLLKYKKGQYLMRYITNQARTFTMMEIAVELELDSEIQLFIFLSGEHVYHQVEGVWVMYSRYEKFGYEITKEKILKEGRVIYYRRITQLGRDFIIGLFFEKNKQLK